MEELWRLIEPHIAREDAVSERAFHFFGGARGWVANALDVSAESRILEIGYGQGLFTAELAERANQGRVSAIDFLQAQSTTATARHLLSRLRLLDRIELATADAVQLPYRDMSFDCAASFLGLQDIEISRGDRGVISTLKEICRVVKPGGNVAVVDDSFPECRPSDGQGRLFSAIRRHWHTLLPSASKIAEMFKERGMVDVSLDEFSPREWIPPAEAERELRKAVEWAKPQGIQVDFDTFWQDAGEIVRREGRHYDRVVMITGRKKDRNSGSSSPPSPP